MNDNDPPLEIIAGPDEPKRTGIPWWVAVLVMLATIGQRTLTGISYLGNRARGGELQGGKAEVIGTLAWYVVEGVGLGLIIVVVIHYGLRSRK